MPVLAIEKPPLIEKVDKTVESDVTVDTFSFGTTQGDTAVSVENPNNTADTDVVFHVKEDDMQLYGFLTKDDLQVFRLLLQVNGIGPKGALGVLSGLTADELRFAILSDDVKTISKAPGIGKKTAQKLILELKDKLNLQDAFEKKYENAAQENVMSDSVTDAKKEAVEALVALGYSSTDALLAVKRAEISEEADVETVLKAALKHI